MQKYFTSLILCVLVLIAVGCRQSKSTITPVVNNISFDAEINFNQDVCIASGVIDKKNTALFKIISPENAKGLEFCVRGDLASVSYGDFTYNLENSEYLTTFKKIYNLLITAKSEDIKFTENRYEYSQRIDGTEFIVIYSQTGLPIEIKSKNGEVDIIFKDIRILN